MNKQEEILNTYEKSSLNFIGNSNSLHKLGLQSKKLENASGKLILDVLNLSKKEVIYTSGNGESYSLLLSNIDDEKEIITDNENFYKLGLEMGKNIRYGEVSNLIKPSTYFVSTCDLSCDFKGLKHIDISYNYDISSLDKFDYITIEDEIPFFGVLIKNKNRELIPIIHGGKSSTNYRSGTAPTNMIASFAKLIKIKYNK